MFILYRCDCYYFLFSCFAKHMAWPNKPIPFYLRESHIDEISISVLFVHCRHRAKTKTTQGYITTCFYVYVKMQIRRRKLNYRQNHNNIQRRRTKKKPSDFQWIYWSILRHKTISFSIDFIVISFCLEDFSFGRRLWVDPSGRLRSISGVACV